MITFKKSKTFLFLLLTKVVLLMSLDFVGRKIGISMVALGCHFIIMPKRKIYKIENISFLLSLSRQLSLSGVFRNVSFAHQVFRV